MLDCGSDAYPAAEGAQGAYGKILNKTGDSVQAEALTRKIILLENRADADKLLEKNGFAKEERDSILASSHCNPPEDYFITSGDMIGKAGVWAHFGLWNFTKAYVAQHSAALPREQAVDDFVTKFGMSKEEAEQLYYEATSLTNEGQINSFAAPWPGYIGGAWSPCQNAANNTTLMCAIGANIGQQGDTTTVIEGFLYNRTNPEASRLVLGSYRGNQRVGQNPDMKPSSIIVAGEEKMIEVPIQDPGLRSVSVLIDVEGKRVLLGDTVLLKSMFTQLYFLDGKYNNHFVKFYDETGIAGGRVVIWKVDWTGTKGPAALRDAEQRAGSATSTTSTVSIIKKNVTNTTT